MRRLAVSFTVGVAAVLTAALAQPAAAYPPSPPGESVTRDHLAQLTVAAEGSMDGYDRDLFPHWSPHEGTCDTRESVLKRDGSGVAVDGSCQPTSGSWYSVYDAQWVSDSSDVHIDHVVPLAEAWRTGARDWTESRREAFANDLGTQQLIAVSGSSNMSKGDDGPEQWQPDNTGYHCMYARSWVNVKYEWSLTVTGDEVTTLENMLSTC
ncbi:HNH endonuclease [Saccharomonospora piscinae]|uniref:HNH endonuclease n=1 Tax=Saccharomonospora piscinae TaxID=687388 RepID=A0A1V9A7G8_SACPI|nr:HNH endonuclease family protein [Saccharomonospora piscinae]OQO93079.1 HNH endonuclease [Saccharomonospora piscinae]